MSLEIKLESTETTSIGNMVILRQRTYSRNLAENFIRKGKRNLKYQVSLRKSVAELPLSATDKKRLEVLDKFGKTTKKPLAKLIYAPA